MSLAICVRLAKNGKYNGVDATVKRGKYLKVLTREEAAARLRDPKEGDLFRQELTSALQVLQIHAKHKKIPVHREWKAVHSLIQEG